MKDPDAEIQLRSALRLVVLVAVVWAIAMVVGLVVGEARVLVIATLVAAWAEGVAILSALAAAGRLSRGQARLGRVLMALVFATVGVVVLGSTS